jgi:hypothetical protein
MQNFESRFFQKLTMVAAVLLSMGFISEELAFAHVERRPSQPICAQQEQAVWLVARRRRKKTVRRRRAPKVRRSRTTKPKPRPAPPVDRPAAAPATQPAETSLPMGPGGRTRVDFDAQMIKGQTTKAGEVQILERKDTELKSMVKRRTSFRKEIILSVFPEKAGSLN